MKTREERLGSGELQRRSVDVPCWGETIVAQLTALEKDRFEISWVRSKDSRGQQQTDHAGFRAFVTMWCVVDESGQRLFTDEDFDALCGKPADIISPIFDAACELNALTKADREALVKN